MVPKKTAYMALAVLLVIGLGAFMLGANHSSNAQNNYINKQSATSVNSTSPNTTTTGTLFESTPYAQFVYVISNSTLSSQAQAALSGFNVTRTQQSNGTVGIGT